MIQVENIIKRYGATIAVNKVSFEVGGGEILGFLGPNGAGKSTTLKIVTSYIVADSGRVVIDGKEPLDSPHEVRRVIGYLPESTPLYYDMAVGEYLRFIARARQMGHREAREGIERAVERVGLRRMFKKSIGHLSKGYKQRVGIAQALIHDPKILIMDEPTSGLDPHQIIEIRELIRELGREKLVVLSSHILQEISAICTRLLVIKDGTLVADGTPDELKKNVDERPIVRGRIHGPANEVLGALDGLGSVSRVESLAEGPDWGEFRVHGEPDVDLGSEVFRAVSEKGWTLSSLASEERSLEEVYLRLTASGVQPQAAAS